MAYTLPYVLGAQAAAGRFTKQAARTNQHDPTPRRHTASCASDCGNNVGAEVAVKRLKNAMYQKLAEGELPPELAQSMGGGEGGGAPPQSAPPQGGPSLGDANYWGGGQQAQPQDAEQAIGLLPGGTFQGANIRITPDGQKNTSIKVSPDALKDPNSLQTFFNTEPGVKIEIAMPTNIPAVQVQPGAGAPGGQPQGPPQGQGQGY